MMVAIGIGAAVVLYLANRHAHQRLNRAERLGLNWYAHKADCEGAFPFDYLSR
jgi:hypothetical protein